MNNHSVISMFRPVSVRQTNLLWKTVDQNYGIPFLPHEKKKKKSCLGKAYDIKCRNFDIGLLSQKNKIMTWKPYLWDKKV